MDDSTKTLVTTIATGVIKKTLISVGSIAAAHGFITGVPVEAYGSAAIAIAAAGISLWQDYGKAIIISQLEVLKARSLAAAAKIHEAGISPVTTAEIAAQSPTLTAASIIKIAATMTPAMQASVVPEQQKPPTTLTPRAAS